MRCAIKQQGVTLLELVIVVLLLTVLMVGGCELVRLGFTSYFKGQNIINADWQGRVALERMSRDIRSVRSENDIIAAAANDFEFTDISGATIRYHLVGTQLLRNNQVLADNVQGLTFSYYDSDGAGTSTLVDIRYVNIALSVQNGDSFNFTTGVTLWNIV